MSVLSTCHKLIHTWEEGISVEKLLLPKLPGDLSEALSSLMLMWEGTIIGANPERVGLGPIGKITLVNQRKLATKKHFIMVSAIVATTNVLT